MKNVAEAGSVASPRGLEPLSAWDPLNFLGLDGVRVLTGVLQEEER